MDKISFKNYILNYHSFETARFDIIKNGSNGFVIFALSRDLRMTIIQYDHPAKHEKVYVTDSFPDIEINDDFGNTMHITSVRTNDFDGLCTSILATAERDDPKNVVNIRDGNGFCILKRRRGKFMRGHITSPDVIVNYFGNFNGKSPALSLQTIFTTMFEQVNIQHIAKAQGYWGYWGGYDPYGSPISDISGFTLKLQPLYVALSEHGLPGEFQEYVLRIVNSLFYKYRRPNPPIMTPYGYVDADDDD